MHPGCLLRSSEYLRPHKKLTGTQQRQVLLLLQIIKDTGASGGVSIAYQDGAARTFQQGSDRSLYFQIALLAFSFAFYSTRCQPPNKLVSLYDSKSSTHRYVWINVWYNNTGDENKSQSRKADRHIDFTCQNVRSRLQKTTDRGRRPEESWTKYKAERIRTSCFSLSCVCLTLFLTLFVKMSSKVNLNLTCGTGSANSHVAWRVKMIFFKSKAANNVTVW